jgi:hypothetical protein
MAADLHDGPLPSAPAQPPQEEKLSWREKRWERRRRRRYGEEILGWILVPVIVLGGYWLLNAILQGLGTSVPAIVSGIQSILASQL